jgi:hypothetical protein
MPEDQEKEYLYGEASVKTPSRPSTDKLRTKIVDVSNKVRAVKDKFGWTLPSGLFDGLSTEEVSLLSTEQFFAMIGGAHCRGKGDCPTKKPHLRLMQ